MGVAKTTIILLGGKRDLSRLGPVPGGEVESENTCVS